MQPHPLYPLSYIVSGDIIDLPLPSYGLYHVVIGRNPAKGANKRYDNFHWMLATKSSSDALSRRALKITIRPDGFLCFTAIGENDCLVKLGEDMVHVIRPGNSSSWLDPKNCYNLVVKIGEIYTFKAQSLGGGTGTPFHVEQLIRHN